MAGAYPVEFEIHAIGRIREDFEEFVDEVLDKHMVQRGIANAECTLDEDSGMIINPIIATLWFNRIWN